ncbi:hypothetical protein Cgig2_017336 [Carnegiea gigantea]|uniref:Cyanobacterial aminoacyl-tRNA synthetase CAAD domain-containing protein n=1 Tax=Carnegiea gigantea TaxID=171969 RepID=A0A9Q1K5R6_9CARY|nr:hypothetical protein Cgig2_017336 [Carnegiea gigantea]
MATATTSSLSLSSSSAAIVDTRAALRQPSSASPQCVSLPTLPPPPVQSQSRRKVARNVVAMATGEAPAEIAEGETPEILKTIQEAWDKVEDKYAVSSLVVAVAVAVYGSAGLISAIDRLPLIPGVLELVGIGYTGWFAYRNLVFKPDREALIQKIKETYKEIIGSTKMEEE